MKEHKCKYLQLMIKTLKNHYFDLRIYSKTNDKPSLSALMMRFYGEKKVAFKIKYCPFCGEKLI